MQYMGGKFRVGAHLASVLQESVDRTGGFYEPFMGGNNILFRLRVHDSESNAVLSDIDESPVVLYEAYLDGWRPPTEVSEDEYRRLREADDPADPLTAFAAYGCSFSGKRWGGYARDPARGRNFAAEAARNLARTVRPARYLTLDYREVEITLPATVYCDPPYRDTTGYSTGPFDHGEFYAWCEEEAGLGAEVFVSEFQAPDHWDVVAEVPRKTTTGFARHARVDRLYRVRTLQ